MIPERKNLRILAIAVSILTIISMVALLLVPLFI